MSSQDGQLQRHAGQSLRGIHPAGDKPPEETKGSRGLSLLIFIPAGSGFVAIMLAYWGKNFFKILDRLAEGISGNPVCSTIAWVSVAVLFALWMMLDHIRRVR